MPTAVILALLALAAFIVLRAIRIVPQGYEFTIERFRTGRLIDEAAAAAVAH